MILHVTSAEYAGEYRVALTFNDGRRGIADLRENLWGSAFEALRDTKLFAQFQLDPELNTIVWSTGADIAPEYLYFLAFQDDPALQERFQRWGYISRPAGNAVLSA